MRAYERDYDWNEFYADDSRRLFTEAWQACWRDHLEDGLPMYTHWGRIDDLDWQPPQQLAPDVSDPNTPTQETMYRQTDDTMEAERNEWAREQFGYEVCQCNYHVQPPGGIVYLHTDMHGPLSRLIKRENLPGSTLLKRCYVVNLTDWHPGQAWMMHDQSYQGWKRGDVMSLPWYVPHSTVNSNLREDAHRLVITGFIKG